MDNVQKHNICINVPLSQILDLMEYTLNDTNIKTGTETLTRGNISKTQAMIWHYWELLGEKQEIFRGAGIQNL
jgi:hypothetical protein